MQCYCLWQNRTKRNRTITVQECDKLPRYARLDTVHFTVDDNHFWGGKDYNFGIYTNKLLDKAKLYQLFVQLRKSGISQDVKIGAEYIRRGKK